MKNFIQTKNKRRWRRKPTKYQKTFLILPGMVGSPPDLNCRTCEKCLVGFWPLSSWSSIMIDYSVFFLWFQLVVPKFWKFCYFTLSPQSFNESLDLEICEWWKTRKMDPRSQTFGYQRKWCCLCNYWRWWEWWPLMPPTTVTVLPTMMPLVRAFNGSFSWNIPSKVVFFASPPKTWQLPNNNLFIEQFKTDYHNHYKYCLFSTLFSAWYRIIVE